MVWCDCDIKLCYWRPNSGPNSAMCLSMSSLFLLIPFGFGSKVEELDSRECQHLFWRTKQCNVSVYVISLSLNPVWVWIQDWRVGFERMSTSVLTCLSGRSNNRRTHFKPHKPIILSQSEQRQLSSLILSVPFLVRCKFVEDTLLVFLFNTFFYLCHHML